MTTIDDDRDTSTNSMQLAYKHTREAILSGELAPGIVLSQVQLARQIGVSRTPLREALRLLEVEGLVDTQAQKQIRIGGMHVDDLEDLYAMRIMLETAAVKYTVPRLDSADFEFMHRALERFDAAVSNSALADLHDPHRDFHHRLFCHAGKRLKDSVSDLWDHAERYRRIYQRAAPDRAEALCIANKEHAAMLAAAERRDANLCSSLLARHLYRTGLSVIRNQSPTRQADEITDALRRVVVGDTAATII